MPPRTVCRRRRYHARAQASHRHPPRSETLETCQVDGLRIGIAHQHRRSSRDRRRYRRPIHNSTASGLSFLALASTDPFR